MKKPTRAQPDFLDEVIAHGTAEDRKFPRLVEAAVARRELLRRLGRRRVQLGLSQAQIAEQMGTSQPAVARLESGEVDARVSTLERFAGAVGTRLEYRLVVPAQRAAAPRTRAASVRA